MTIQSTEFNNSGLWNTFDCLVEFHIILMNISEVDPRSKYLQIVKAKRQIEASIRKGNRLFICNHNFLLTH